MDSAELEGLGRQIAYGAYPLVLRQSRYAGDQPPPASWRGWSQVAAQVGLGSDAAAARTAMEAVARAQAQQTAVLVGDAGGAPAGGGGAPGGAAEVESPPRPRRRGSAPSGGGGGGAPAPPPEDEMVVLRDFGIMVRDSRGRRGETTYRVGFLDDDGRDLGLDQDQWLPAGKLRDGHPQGAQAIAAFEDSRTRRAGTARGEPSAKEKEALRAAGRSEPSPPRRDLRRMRREERQDATKEGSAAGVRPSRSGRKRSVPQRVTREEVEEEPVKKKRGPGRPRKNPVPSPKKKRGPGRPRKQQPVAEEPSEDAAELLDTQPESEDLPRGGGAGTSGVAAGESPRRRLRRACPGPRAWGRGSWSTCTAGSSGSPPRLSGSWTWRT